MLILYFSIFYFQQFYYLRAKSLIYYLIKNQNITKNLHHPNRIDFRAQYLNGSKDNITYYSVGGGFIEKDGKLGELSQKADIPYPIQTAKDIVDWCQSENKTLPELSMANETCWLDKQQVIKSLDKIFPKLAELENLIISIKTPGWA